jgi:Uma2 family endonuclease
MSDKILTQSEKIYTAEDYLRFDRRDQPRKDRASMVPGSSRVHNLIATNTTIAIGSRIRGQGKEVYVNDMRVKMSDNNYSYPDVIVVAGEPAFEGKELDILTNPTVIVEIMSRASLAQDKTEKLERYLSIDSVKEILLVKEEDMHVEHYHRQTINQWIYKICTVRDDVVSLDSINCKVSLGEIYAQIRIEAA